jgi:putative Mn2+ efflux pump MntP
MHPVYIFLIAVSLAMDALSVAVALSLKFRWVSFRQFFRLSFHFGFFQFLMPILGWSAGVRIGTFISDYDHWAAFLLLTFLGIKLIKEPGGETGYVKAKDPTRGRWLILLSLATSIDALVVGVSLSFIGVSIWIPSLIIGAVAALFTLFGMYFGSKLRGKTTEYLGMVGGVTLIGIGIKILVEDLFF